MSELSLSSQNWLLSETATQPRHLGQLLLFRKPERSSPDFVLRLYDQFAKASQPVSPFNWQLQSVRKGLRRFSWRVDTEFQLQRHWRYHKLRHPGPLSRLHQLINDLHQPVMDRSRPLWEAHLIDGLRHREFAIYIKVHRAVCDLSRLWQSLSNTLRSARSAKAGAPLWMSPYASEHSPIPTGKGKQQSNMLLGLGRMALQWTPGPLRRKSPVSILGLGRTDESLLNGCAEGRKQLMFGQIGCAQVSSLAKQAGCSDRAVFLYLIEQALHQSLDINGTINNKRETGLGIQVPQRWLNARADASAWTNIELPARDQKNHFDPLRRLQQIQTTLNDVTAAIQGQWNPAAHFQSAAADGIGGLLELSGLTDLWRIGGHFKFSQGGQTRRPLYLNGARMQASYAIDHCSPGQRMALCSNEYDGQHFMCLLHDEELQLDSSELAELWQQTLKDLEAAIDPI